MNSVQAQLNSGCMQIMDAPMLQNAKLIHMCHRRFVLQRKAVSMMLRRSSSVAFASPLMKVVTDAWSALLRRTDLAWVWQSSS